MLKNLLFLVVLGFSNLVMADPVNSSCKGASIGYTFNNTGENFTGTISMKDDGGDPISEKINYMVLMNNSTTLYVSATLRIQVTNPSGYIKFNKSSVEDDRQLGVLIDSSGKQHVESLACGYK